ncbi:TetR/AcrR family transcriptional regulator [Granulicella arctica]|uniref:TetR/AcrR family transcriptional regulator n=1 Tax=Granulicella arctica TaxID=940613 RepID=UPI0021E082B7|nr:TetR/AcrR family transcriptional regulator [Granulicella arctica]
MARVRSPEKRTAILRAAIDEIAAVGLSAPTAKIAERAGIAAGTLFTYFPTKDDLFNELYLELKSEAYVKVNTGFPHKGSLESRTRHIWLSYLDWSIASPEKRKASMQLHLSDLITPETRERAGSERGAVEATLRELGARSSLRNMPAGFAAATMSAMQEATMEFAAKDLQHRDRLLEEGFRIYWRAVR